MYNRETKEWERKKNSPEGMPVEEHLEALNDKWNDGIDFERNRHGR